MGSNNGAEKRSLGSRGWNIYEKLRGGFVEAKGKKKRKRLLMIKTAPPAFCSGAINGGVLAPFDVTSALARQNARSIDILQVLIWMRKQWISCKCSMRCMINEYPTGAHLDA